MAQITSSVGLISGIDTGAIINELISLDAEPVTLLQDQIASATAQNTAYQSLESQINTIQSVGQSLALPQTFQAATANSSDQNVLTATTSVGAAVGTYQLQVAQLVNTQQTISQGYSSPNSLVGAGTITLEEGGGLASSQTPLATLNGGAGVAQGQFRITDRAGNSQVIDTTDDINLDDVVNQINSAQNIDVHASIEDNNLVLTDETGSTASNLIVQDLSGGSAAQDLGIAGSVASNVLTGTDINTISTNTSLAQLNDGNGVGTTSAGQNDFLATLADGTNVSVSLNGATSVGDVLNDINTAGAGKLTAAINSQGTGIALTDNTTGSGTFTLTAENGSPALADLKLTSPAAGNSITGGPLIASLDSVLTSSLKGGSGIPLGFIAITNSLGSTTDVNLSNATSFSDIINDINNAGNDVTASLNAAGTGLQLTDTAGGTQGLTVADLNSTTAAALGIAGTFASGTVNGGNLQHQYVSANTTLANYNAGNGVPLGQFQITNSAGVSATVTLASGTTTLGDVITDINDKNIGVTASINANGNGILLTDTAGGTGKLAVTDLGGTTAASLNIAGTATGTTIDGALQKTITVSSTDTLSSLETKINQLGFGVTANIINDGSSSSPYRLSLTAINSGTAGQVVIDSGDTNLQLQNLVQAQDAAVFLGGGDGDQPLLLTSNTNQITNVINGVTISLVGASSTPVTLSVTSDPSGIATQLQSLVTSFNSLVGQIDQESQFNTSNNTGGILLGDATAQQIEQTLYGVVNTVVAGAGQYQDLADIGVTINSNGTTGSPTLNFDSSTFDAAFAADPTAVSNLFTQAKTGLATAITNATDSLTDPVDGIITLESNTLNTQIAQYQANINQLNAILADKRNQLEQQFADMESTLATLESQSEVISSLGTLKDAVSASSAGSSAASSSSSGSSGSVGSSSSSSGSGA
ncbi:MAG: flagellar filament capping protein FliD [Tepidisphaeraceae bacterium]|jgi:flagellar hook-associated protein 2